MIRTWNKHWRITVLMCVFLSAFSGLASGAGQPRSLQAVEGAPKVNQSQGSGSFWDVSTNRQGKFIIKSRGGKVLGWTRGRLVTALPRKGVCYQWVATKPESTASGEPQEVRQLKCGSRYLAADAKGFLTTDKTKASSWEFKRGRTQIKVRTPGKGAAKFLKVGTDVRLINKADKVGWTVSQDAAGTFTIKSRWGTYLGARGKKVISWSEKPFLWTIERAGENGVRLRVPKGDYVRVTKGRPRADTQRASAQEWGIVHLPDGKLVLEVAGTREAAGALYVGEQRNHRALCPSGTKARRLVTGQIQCVRCPSESTLNLGSTGPACQKRVEVAPKAKKAIRTFPKLQCPRGSSEHLRKCYACPPRFRLLKKSSRSSLKCSGTRGAAKPSKLLLGAACPAGALFSNSGRGSCRTCPVGYTFRSGAPQKRACVRAGSTLAVSTVPSAAPAGATAEVHTDVSVGPNSVSASGTFKLETPLGTWTFSEVSSSVDLSKQHLRFTAKSSLLPDQSATGFPRELKFDSFMKKLGTDYQNVEVSVEIGYGRDFSGGGKVKLNDEATFELNDNEQYLYLDFKGPRLQSSTGGVKGDFGLGGLKMLSRITPDMEPKEVEFFLGGDIVNVLTMGLVPDAFLGVFLGDPSPVVTSATKFYSSINSTRGVSKQIRPQFMIRGGAGLHIPGTKIGVKVIGSRYLRVDGVSSKGVDTKKLDIQFLYEGNVALSVGVPGASVKLPTGRGGILIKTGAKKAYSALVKKEVHKFSMDVFMESGPTIKPPAALIEAAKSLKSHTGGQIDVVQKLGELLGATPPKQTWIVKISEQDQAFKMKSESTKILGVEGGQMTGEFELKPARTLIPTIRVATTVNVGAAKADLSGTIGKTKWELTGKAKIAKLAKVSERLLKGDAEFTVNKSGFKIEGEATALGSKFRLSGHVNPSSRGKTTFSLKTTGETPSEVAGFAGAKLGLAVDQGGADLDGSVNVLGNGLTLNGSIRDAQLTIGGTVPLNVPKYAGLTIKLEQKIGRVTSTHAGVSGYLKIGEKKYSFNESINMKTGSLTSAKFDEMVYFPNSKDKFIRARVQGALGLKKSGSKFVPELRAALKVENWAFGKWNTAIDLDTDKIGDNMQMDIPLPAPLGKIKVDLKTWKIVHCDISGKCGGGGPSQRELRWVEVDYCFKLVGNGSTKDKVKVQPLDSSKKVLSTHYHAFNQWGACHNRMNKTMYARGAKYVRLTATGGDALLIDRIMMGFHKEGTKRQGVDGGGFWCLSTQSSDSFSHGTGRNKKTVKCKKSIDFKID